MEVELGGGGVLVLEVDRPELGVDGLERRGGGGAEEVVVALARARGGLGDGGSGVVVLLVLLLLVGGGEVDVLAAVGAAHGGCCGGEFRAQGLRGAVRETRGDCDGDGGGESEVGAAGRVYIRGGERGCVERGEGRGWSVRTPDATRPTRRGRRGGCFAKGMNGFVFLGSTIKLPLLRTVLLLIWNTLTRVILYI